MNSQTNSTTALKQHVGPCAADAGIDANIKTLLEQRGETAAQSPYGASEAKTTAQEMEAA